MKTWTWSLDVMKINLFPRKPCRSMSLRDGWDLHSFSQPWLLDSWINCLGMPGYSSWEVFYKCIYEMLKWGCSRSVRQLCMPRVVWPFGVQSKPYWLSVVSGSVSLPRVFYVTLPCLRGSVPDAWCLEFCVTQLCLCGTLPGAWSSIYHC